MSIVGLILLLASVNLSGLLVARAAARQREISIRLAIGAGRGRLIRQFLTESLVLASLGAGIGLVVAHQLSKRLTSLFLNGRELELSVAPEWRVLVFTAAVSLTACVLAGLVPAMQALRTNLHPALKEVRAQGHWRLGRALVMAQVAISMVLIVGATLFVGTLVKLYAAERGFDGDGVLAVSIRSTGPLPPDRATAAGADVVDRLNALPGVELASAAQVLPVSGNDWTRAIQLPADADRPVESETAFNVIASGYFATLGMRLLAGRDFDNRDRAGAPPVAIVNESFSRYFFGDRSPIGRRVTSVNVSYEIVGVVSDAMYEDLRKGFRRTMYTAWLQRDGAQPSNYQYLLRVAGGDPRRLAPAIARAVYDADPALQMRNAITYGTLIDRSIPAERILATLGGLFGLLALVVAGIGMFGLLAYQVARRTNELGVRMVLGATRGSMMRLVLSDVVWMLVPGHRGRRGRRADGDRVCRGDSLRAHADRTRGVHRRRVGARGGQRPRWLAAGPPRVTRRSARGAPPGLARRPPVCFPQNRLTERPLPDGLPLPASVSVASSASRIRVPNGALAWPADPTVTGHRTLRPSPS